MAVVSWATAHVGEFLHCLPIISNCWWEHHDSFALSIIEHNCSSISKAGKRSCWKLTAHWVPDRHRHEESRRQAQDPVVRGGCLKAALWNGWAQEPLGTWVEAGHCNLALTYVHVLCGTSPWPIFFPRNAFEKRGIETNFFRLFYFEWVQFLLLTKLDWG